MVYTVLAGLIIAVALVTVLFAGRLLLKGKWILGWLRGMAGIALLLGSAVMAFGAFDFYSYKQLSKEQTIANISFTKIEPQKYQVSLVDSEGVEQLFELNGDLWQLDARIIKWSKLFAGAGLTPGYRLDRISGRYYALEEEKSGKRTVYELGNSKSVIDLWSWARQFGKNITIVDASYGSATYLPMEDGALFSVILSSTGLLARPLNDRAELAVNRWK
jgi:hypothetical protein